MALRLERSVLTARSGCGWATGGATAATGATGSMRATAAGGEEEEEEEERSPSVLICGSVASPCAWLCDNVCACTCGSGACCEKLEVDVIVDGTEDDAASAKRFSVAISASARASAWAALREPREPGAVPAGMTGMTAEWVRWRRVTRVRRWVWRWTIVVCSCCDGGVW